MRTLFFEGPNFNSTNINYVHVWFVSKRQKTLRLILLPKISTCLVILVAKFRTTARFWTVTILYITNERISTQQSRHCCGTYILTQLWKAAWRVNNVSQDGYPGAFDQPCRAGKRGFGLITLLEECIPWLSGLKKSYLVHGLIINQSWHSILNIV